MPQRRLSYELRIAIDRCVRSDDRRYGERLVRLVEANPRGVWSSHVQHNLGVSRRTWLVAFAARNSLRVAATLKPLVREEREDGSQAHEALG